MNELVKKLSKTFLFLLVLGLGFLALPTEVKASLNTDYVELVVTFQKANGESCTADTDCISGHCVDGYCCDTACTEVCKACNVSGHLGTCYNAPINTDPHDDCDSYCIGSCEVKTGNCDGAGACQASYCPAGTACSSGACGAGYYCNTTWALCSSQGDNHYNDGGNTYTCQAQCDGSNNCDYAANCYIKRSGYCYLEKADDNSQITVKWTDDSDSESGYEIDKNTDNGGWADLTTEAANSISYTDNAVSIGHTYQYRLRPTFSDGNLGTWCFTAELNLGTGGLEINSLEINSLKIN